LFYKEVTFIRVHTKANCAQTEGELHGCYQSSILSKCYS